MKMQKRLVITLAFLIRIGGDVLHLIIPAVLFALGLFAVHELSEWYWRVVGAAMLLGSLRGVLSLLDIFISIFLLVKYLAYPDSIDKVDC